MHRFFIAPELVKEIGIYLSLPKELAHQVRDVLHLSIGEQLLLLNNLGEEVLASVVSSSRGGVVVELLERHSGKKLSPVRIVLCQGLLKSARFEWILEKGTELGVAVFAPILCRRSLSGLEEVGSSKFQRWQRIIQEAAEQSGQAYIPQLLPVHPLSHALNDISPGALAIMPWEEEQHMTLREALRSVANRVLPPSTNPSLPSFDLNKIGPAWSTRSPSATNHLFSDSLLENAATEVMPALPHPTVVELSPTSEAMTVSPSIPGTTQTVVLFIGPEGGLESDEVTLARRHGVQIVTLGPRILRAETAALAAIANVMYELEHI